MALTISKGTDWLKVMFWSLIGALDLYLATILVLAALGVPAPLQWLLNMVLGI